MQGKSWEDPAERCFEGDETAHDQVIVVVVAMARVAESNALEGEGGGGSKTRCCSLNRVVFRVGSCRKTSRIWTFTGVEP